MRRNVTRLAAILGASLIGLGVSAALAEQTATKSETKTFTVISVEGNQLVVRLPEGTREITVPEDFRFTVNGQPMSVHELKPGMSGTATITTTTTVKPVTVTQVKEGTVQQVAGSSVIVRTAEGFKMFSPGDLEKRNVTIMKDGQPVQLSDLHAGDKLTATIITEKPPQVMTKRQVDASLASGSPEKASAAISGGAATSGASAGQPLASARSTGTGAGTAASSATRKMLPKTASRLPVLGLIGLVSLAIGLALSFRQRRRLG